MTIFYNGKVCVADFTEDQVLFFFTFFIFVSGFRTELNNNGGN